MLATLTRRMYKGINSTVDKGQTPVVTHSLRGEGFDASEDGTGRGTPLVPVAFQSSQSGIRIGETHATLDSNNGVVHAMQVRRLTPTECERLQGFPDGYTDIKPKGKATPDGPRYKALGNSMAVPVMRWLGKRIQLAVDCEGVVGGST